VEDDFAAFLQEGNTEAAWRLLSGKAEDAFALDQRRARPRGEPGRPVLTEGHAAKPPTVQTLRERKLRRAARRLAAVLQKERAGLLDVDYEKGKLAGYVRHIADAYPDLGDLLQYQGEEQLAYLQHAAEAEETRANQARLEGWKAKVKTDLPKLSRWVKASLAEPRLSRRQRFGANFGIVPDGLQLRDLLARLHLPRAAAPEVQVSGEVLRARASARKAAGCDDWSGRLWRGLPLEFFDSLAAIWNLVLKGAPIPAAWLQVRVCLIPKEEGGQRPLAIAALAWRLGATAVVQQLEGWITAVFPPDLFGGLPGRCAEDIHFRLTHALFVQRAGGPVAGCKADVKKCFDTADPKLAILCLRALGAPEPMLDVIDRFYGQHTRWLSVDGMFSRSPIEGAAALLQGCPFSPLNAMMAVWLARVQAADTRCNFAVYLDDRTIWTRQLRGAARSVQRAIEAGAVADEVVGVPQQVTFKLLGVPYNVYRQAPVATSGITNRLEGRCKRIQLCGQSYSVRRALLARLVVPLFRWCAPWIRQLKRLTARWAGAIERAVWGGAIPRGRSRALAWTTLVGLQFFPDYVNAEATVLQEHRRLHLARHAREAPNTQAAFDYFGWRRTGDTWLCRQGSFKAGTLSAASLRRLLRRDGAFKLFKADTKVKEEGGIAADFDLTHHQTLAGNVEGYFARVMVGGASDARHVVPAHIDFTSRRCTCGRPGPTRTHLTFECPSTPWLLEMRTALERRLLLPLCPRLPCWETADYDPGIAEVADYLGALDENQAHYCATDGGCLLAR
ncbi:Cacna1h, partial [Symbiodinium pilosum]